MASSASSDPTPRQLDAQALRARGLTYRQIAKLLGIAPGSVTDLLYPEKRQARQKRAKDARLREREGK